MSESRHKVWERHFDGIGEELLRLAIACDLRLKEPGVIDRILANDETVCGIRNPVGFHKLHLLVKATYDSLEKALGRIGPEETREITDALTARIEHLRAIGEGRASGPAPGSKPGQ
ncbi:MAG: hypothetical protein JNM50_07705 [Chromatiales bacterium]|jgi:hypothetical protein|nr:hypothetical protein [Chromatiales bacterium]